MNKHLIILALAAAATLGTSCEKREGTVALVPEEGEGKEIVFKVSNVDFGVSTRTTPVTTSSLNSFTVVAFTGEAEVTPMEIAWTATATKDGSVWKTGKYWPSSNPGWKMFATNIPESKIKTIRVYDFSDDENVIYGIYSFEGDLDTGGPCGLAADTDWVVARGADGNFGWTYNTTNTLSFQHILSRIGTIKINAPAGYTLSLYDDNEDGEDWCVRISPGDEEHSLFGSNLSTEHIYNFIGGFWQSWGDTFGDVESADSYYIFSWPTSDMAGFAAGTPFTLDGWFMPEHSLYKIKVAFTLTKGDFTQSYIREQEITLAKGKINNITVNVSMDPAVNIDFNVSVQEWSTNPVNATLS